MEPMCSITNLLPVLMGNINTNKITNNSIRRPAADILFRAGSDENLRGIPGSNCAKPTPSTRRQGNQGEGWGGWESGDCQRKGLEKYQSQAKSAADSLS